LYAQKWPDVKCNNFASDFLPNVQKTEGMEHIAKFGEQTNVHFHLSHIRPECIWKLEVKENLRVRDWETTASMTHTSNLELTRNIKNA